MPTISHPKAFSQTPAFLASGMLGISRSMYTSLHKLKPLQTQASTNSNTRSHSQTFLIQASTNSNTGSHSQTYASPPKQVPLVSWALSEVGPFFLVLARPSGKKSLPNNFFIIFQNLMILLSWIKRKIKSNKLVVHHKKHQRSCRKLTKTDLKIFKFNWPGQNSWNSWVKPVSWPVDEF